MPNDWNLAVAGQFGAPGGAVGPPGPPGAAYLATSVTNLPIATGPITVTTQAGLAYLPGARARLSSNSNPNQWMEGLVTAYSGTSLSVNVDLTSAIASTVAPPVLPFYLGGLTLANNATSPNTVLNIGYGAATSDDYSTLMTIPTANFTKNANAAWAVGSGNGALDSGSALAASTWYHVFLIERSDTGIVDVLISTSASAPLMPTSYDKKRRIGSIKTNASSQILGFIQLGDQFLWTTLPAGWETSNAAVAATPGTIFVVNTPLGVKTLAIINVAQTVWTGQLSIASLDSAAQATQNMPFINTAAGSAQSNNQFTIRTDVNSQIRVSGSSPLASGLYISCLGWYDYRGK